MKTDTPELFFAARELFREWLAQNWDTSGGIWLAFDKSKARKSLSANEALEEALCYGWIDGQMQSIDETKYVKYFARRRSNSVWSEKNKKLVAALRDKRIDDRRRRGSRENRYSERSMGRRKIGAAHR
jgi:uncharacterized protein YdeI (YjbR/CyaY-like superfamily)